MGDLEAGERAREREEEDAPKPMLSKGLLATAVHTSSRGVGRPAQRMATTSATDPRRLSIALRLCCSNALRGASSSRPVVEAESSAWRLSERFEGDDSPEARAENEPW